MTKKRYTQNNCTNEPKLKISLDDAQKKLTSQIEKGKNLLNITIQTEAEFKSAEHELIKWKEYIYDLLKSIFTTAEIANNPDFQRSPILDLHLPRRIDSYKSRVQSCISALESLINRLGFYIDKENIYESQKTQNNNKIFIVHGHDTEAKLEVKHFITKLGLTPIILEENPNGGFTIIEKIEEYSDVSFVIVLLTPDDIGYPNNKPEQKKSRARQNVILELGYFMGQLGRKNVCALYKSDIELPSDYNGVLYISFDSDWRMKICGEMKKIGIDADLNNLI